MKKREVWTGSRSLVKAFLSRLNNSDEAIEQFIGKYKVLSSNLNHFRLAVREAAQKRMTFVGRYSFKGLLEKALLCVAPV